MKLALSAFVDRVFSRSSLNSTNPPPACYGLNISFLCFPPSKTNKEGDFSQKSIKLAR